MPATSADVLTAPSTYPSRLVFALVLGLLAGCSSGDGTKPSPDTRLPSALAKSSTDPQNGVVGTPVASAPSVTVTDANGIGLGGVVVTFEVKSGGGTMTVATPRTSAGGVATLGSWTLGPVPGANTVTASAFGLRVVFTATGAAGPPDTLTVAPSNVGLLLGTSRQLTISAFDQYGNSTAVSPAATYTSANTAVATVSATGLVSAVAVGTTQIAVRSGIASKIVPVVIGRVDVPEGGSPIAVRASVNGVVLVAEPNNNRLGRYDLLSTVSSGTITVGNSPADVNFSPDGSTAYVANQNSGTLGVINVATNTQVSTVVAGAFPVRVVPSRDGSKIYVCGDGGELVTVDATTLVVPLALYLGGPLNGLAVHPSQPLIYVTSTAGQLFEVNETTRQLLRSVSTGGRAQEVVVSKDGTRLYIAIETGALEIRATADLGLIGTIPAATGAFGAALTPDGTKLYVTVPSAGKVLVIDVATNTVLRTIDGGVPRRVAFTADGTIAIIANELGYVSFIN